MTLSKLAQLAGCSVSTVSKAFHDSPEISEETRKKIFDIAKKIIALPNIILQRLESMFLLPFVRK